MMRILERTSFYLFVLSFVLLQSSRAEFEQHNVSSQHKSESDKNHDRQALPNLNVHTNFKNLTVYLSFLDDIFSHLSSSQNISEECRNETNRLLQKADEGDSNALKILDSVGKPASGILEGGVFFIGFYSECVTSVVNISLTEKILGQYCLINFNFSSSASKELPQVSWQVITQSQKPPTIGICIPSSCSMSDLNLATSLCLNGNIDNVQSDVTVCYAEPLHLSKSVGAIIILCIIVIVLVISVAATIIDLVKDNNKCLTTAGNIPVVNAKSISREVLCEVPEQKPPILKRSGSGCWLTSNGKFCFSLGTTKHYAEGNILLECLLAFSFKQNAKKIFTVEKGRETIPCIHGLKFLSMALIILGHTFSFASQNLFFRNPGAAGEAPKDFLSQIFANGTLAVDTFYFISGLLVAYVTLKYLEKTQGKFAFGKFYFHRYFRLTPLMIMVVLICAYLIRYLGSGPNWLSSIMMYDEWCRENGYLNALYLHNFIHTEHMCLSHSWYLATDMQFYLVAPAILIPLHKNFKYGAISSSIFLIATTVATAVLTVLNHYPAIPYINNVVPQDIVNAYYKNVYIKPYCRMGPYIIGIFVGYLILHKKELSLNRFTSILLWLFSVILGLSIIYLMWPANLGHIPNDSQAAAYSSLARTFWGVCIGWLVIACNYGYGGFINSILSWTPLVPLSRLTYCAYLIHPVVMNIYYGSTQVLVDFSQSYMIYLFLGNICITFALSVILSLMFESPFVSLEKVILTGRSK